MVTADMHTVIGVTPYAIGISESRCGSGILFFVNARGVYMGMKAVAKHKFSLEKMNKIKNYAQGVGYAGETLVERLTKEGALVEITDITQSRLEEVAKKNGANIFTSVNLYKLDVDLYAPCAPGGIIIKKTI